VDRNSPALHDFNVDADKVFALHVPWTVKAMGAASQLAEVAATITGKPYLEEIVKGCHSGETPVSRNGQFKYKNCPSMKLNRDLASGMNWTSITGGVHFTRRTYRIQS